MTRERSSSTWLATSKLHRACPLTSFLAISMYSGYILVNSWVSTLNFYDLSMVDPEADLLLLGEGGMRGSSLSRCSEWLIEITGI